jgi:hypothetical protein
MPYLYVTIAVSVVICLAWRTKTDSYASGMVRPA